MSKTFSKQSRAADSGDFAPLWVMAVVLLLIGLFGVSALLVNQNSRTVAFDCLLNTCPTSIVNDLQASSSRLVQDFDVEIRLKGQQKSLQGPRRAPQQITADGMNQIALSSVGEGKIVTHLPMRFGSAPSFDNFSPKLKTLNSVRIRVMQGREMFIYLNGKISYTHRYQLPVFFSNPVELIQPAVPDSGYVSTIRVTKSLVYQERAALQRLSNLLFIIFGLLVSVFICLILLRKFGIPKSKLVRLNRAPVFTWIGLWLVSLVAWKMGPFDPTGAVNPGLFGPIGPAFSDYFQISQISHFNQPYLFGGVAYPPFALVVLKGLSFLLPDLLGLALIVAITFGVLSFMFFQVTRTSTRTTRFQNVLIFLLPYPLVFGIVRGNIDLLAAALIWLAFLLRNSKYAIWPGLVLACAISLKAWPIVFIFFFLRWGHKKVVLVAAGLAAVFTFGSPFFLGYQNISDGFHVAFLSLSASSTVTSSAFHDTFSMSSLLYFGHILLLSHNPIHPSPLDLANGLSFAGSPTAKILLVMVSIFLVRMIWKSKTISRSYLFCSGLALLISTPTYTYRGVILVAYFYLVWQESSQSGKNQVRSKSGNVQVVTLPNRKSSRVIKGSDQKELVKWLKGVREYAWLPILAPTTILFVRDTQISIASVLQPASLVALLAIEVYLSKLEVES